MDCDVQWKMDCNITTSDDQGSGWTEKKLQTTCKSQTCTKKGHGHCLVFCCLSDPLQLSESWWNHAIWEVCSANTRDAPNTAMTSASTGDQKGLTSSPHQCPTTRPTTNAPKVEWIELWNFASSTIFTWLLAKRPPLLQSSQQLFARKMFPQPTRGRKCFPRVRPEAWIFTLQE